MGRPEFETMGSTNMSDDNHYSCNNCTQIYCFHYANENKICSGIVKNVDPDIPFDVIRLCINTTSEELQVYDYTPDEVSSIISVLSLSLGEWLSETKTYKQFRKIPDISDIEYMENTST